MLLAVDIGNTNITFGFFDGDKLKYKFTIATLEYNKELFIKNINTKKVQSCIISSVVDDIGEEIENDIQKIFNINPLIMSFKLCFDMNIKAEYPEKIGTDRLINAYIAGKMYSKPAIVVDMGTATTFDIIDSNGDFIGGVILPGINTQLKSLSINTSKLPALTPEEFDKTSKTISTETSKAILSGVIRGHAHAIEGLIEDCKREMDAAPLVIATGGFAGLVSQVSEYNKFDIINPDLTLYGLQTIFKNVHKINC